jgi:hypothetical protein
MDYTSRFKPVEALSAIYLFDRYKIDLEGKDQLEIKPSFLIPVRATTPLDSVPILMIDSLYVTGGCATIPWGGKVWNLHQEQYEKYRISIEAHKAGTQYSDLYVNSDQFFLEESFWLDGVKWLRQACRGEIVSVTIYATLFDRKSLTVIATQVKTGQYRLKVIGTPYINAD